MSAADAREHGVRGGLRIDAHTVDAAALGNGELFARRRIGAAGLIGKFGHIEPFGTGAEDGEKAFGLRIVENGRCAAAYVDGG